VYIVPDLSACTAITLPAIDYLTGSARPTVPLNALLALWRQLIATRVVSYWDQVEANRIADCIPAVCYG
jgi:hypothetical protein